MLKKIFIIFILLGNNLCFSQNDSLPDLVIQYSNDKSIFLTGYQQSKLNSDSKIAFDSKISLDTLVKYYTIQLEFIPDTSYLNLIQKHIYLDSIHFSELIIKADLRMRVVKYGYGGARNYEDLSAEYGVKYYAGGCIYDPSAIEKEYSTFMNMLLEIRNGKNWEIEYNKKARKKK